MLYVSALHPAWGEWRAGTGCLCWSKGARGTISHLEGCAPYSNLSALMLSNASTLHRILYQLKLFVFELNGHTIDPHSARAINTSRSSPHRCGIFRVILSYSSPASVPLWDILQTPLWGWWLRAPVWPPSTRCCGWASGPHYLSIDWVSHVRGMWAGSHQNRR